MVRIHSPRPILINNLAQFTTVADLASVAELVATPKIPFIFAAVPLHLTEHVAVDLMVVFRSPWPRISITYCPGRLAQIARLRCGAGRENKSGEHSADSIILYQSRNRLRRSMGVPILVVDT